MNEDVVAGLPEAVAAWAKEADPPPRHPSVEELAAYATGRLAGAAAARLEDHLVLCRECASLLLDFAELATGDAPAATATEVDAVWRAVAAEAPPEAPAPRAAPVSRPAPRARPAPRWPYAIAASLLAATVGLSVWVVALRRTVAELSAPVANAPVRDLRPLDARPRGEGEELVEAFAGQPVALVLDPAGEPPAGPATVEIAGPGGAVLFRRRGLLLNRYGSYTLILPAEPPGEYHLRLFAGEGKRPFAEYALRLTSWKAGKDG